MPIATETGGNFVKSPRLPIGENHVKIANVWTKEEFNQFKSENELRVKWKFVPSNADEYENQDDVPVLIHTTGIRYGAPNAKLTMLLDQIFGFALGEAEAKKIDLERLVGVTGSIFTSPYTTKDGERIPDFTEWTQSDTELNPSYYYLDSVKQTPMERPAPAPAPARPAAAAPQRPAPAPARGPQPRQPVRSRSLQNDEQVYDDGTGEPLTDPFDE